MARFLKSPLLPRLRKDNPPILRRLLHLRHSPQVVTLFLRPYLYLSLLVPTPMTLQRLVQRNPGPISRGCHLYQIIEAVQIIPHPLQVLDSPPRHGRHPMHRYLPPLGPHHHNTHPDAQIQQQVNIRSDGLSPVLLNYRTKGPATLIQQMAKGMMARKSNSGMMIS